jgi:protein disulfide-isomerase-like protein
MDSAKLSATNKVTSSLKPVIDMLKNKKVCISIIFVLIIVATAVAVWYFKFRKNETDSSKEKHPQPVEQFEQQDPVQQNASGKTLALFYAPWCGHCKKVMPVWDRLDETHRANGLGEITVVKVNCDEQKDMAKKHSVGGFPTIKLLPQGINVPDQSVEYQGDRSYDSLVKFMSAN